MRTSVLIFLATVLFYQPCRSQTKAKITDVDFHIDENERFIVVNYNLTGTLPKEEMTIELKFVSENNETINPRIVSGDFGTKLFSDGAKQILWDIVYDPIVFSGNLKAVVSITSSKILYHGGSYAFLSFIPGLGGYFVDKNKTRSVLTTLSVTGLMGYSLFQLLQKNKYYNQYKDPTNTKSDEIESRYTKANNAYHNCYKAFDVGIGIMALDFIYVAIKGIHNKNKAESAYKAFSGDGLKVNYVSNGLQFGYSVSF